MTVLMLNGIVECGDGARVAEEGLRGAVYVGGRDLVEEVFDAGFGGAPVTFAFVDERHEGPLAIDFGYGYSEYTPVEWDKLFIGPHDILKILEGCEGRFVTVWFADEPFNRIELSMGI